jgi:hypothetical protein
MDIPESSGLCISARRRMRRIGHAVVPAVARAVIDAPCAPARRRSDGADHRIAARRRRSPMPAAPRRAAPRARRRQAKKKPPVRPQAERGGRGQISGGRTSTRRPQRCRIFAAWGPAA